MVLPRPECTSPDPARGRIHFREASDRPSGQKSHPPGGWLFPFPAPPHCIVPPRFPHQISCQGLPLGVVLFLPIERLMPCFVLSEARRDSRESGVGPGFPAALCAVKIRWRMVNQDRTAPATRSVDRRGTRLLALPPRSLRGGRCSARVLPLAANYRTFRPVRRVASSTSGPELTYIHSS